MHLLFIACTALGLIALALLFGGIVDFGFIDLTSTLSKFAAVALLTFVLVISLGSFALMKMVSGERTFTERHLAVLLSTVEERLRPVEDKIASHLGEDFNRLKAENESFKSELEKIRQAESEKIIQELDFLKEQNSILQEQLGKKAKLHDETVGPAEQPSRIQNAG